jgi:hypothetical protein
MDEEERLRYMSDALNRAADLALTIARVFGPELAGDQNQLEGLAKKLSQLARKHWGRL